MDAGTYRNFSFFVLVGVLMLGAGCATEYQPLPQVPPAVSKPAGTSEHAPGVAVSKKPEGIYHKVGKGQTIWRIAQAYGVPVDDIIQSNHIPNAAAIEVNQLLFIPGAKTPRPITAELTPAETKQAFIWPLKGKIIAYFNDHFGQAVNHGVDIEANEGDPVKASRDGTVVLASYMAGYGQTVILDHEDGFFTVYAQNRKLLVKTTDHVSKGDLIAEAGRVGKKSLLHFELRKGERAINPLYYLP
jgi:murein DD-endopeptidase MepM/ murein hydrolase activator NlpD